MAEPCAMAIASGVPADSGQCPYLEFEGDISSCGLAAKMPSRLRDLAFGFGKGCCMAGTILAQGKQHNIAAMPAVDKQYYVRRLREGRGQIIHNKKGKQ